MAHTRDARYTAGLLSPLPVPHVTFDSLPYRGASVIEELWTRHEVMSHE